MPQLLTGADVLVNNMRAGAPDKVVYEAAASCVPVVASNPVFDTLLPASLRFDREDPRSLAGTLAAFARAPAEERAATGRTLRATVKRDHSVDTWADRIVELAR